MSPSNITGKIGTAVDFHLKTKVGEQLLAGPCRTLSPGPRGGESTVALARQNSPRRSVPLEATAALSALREFHERARCSLHTLALVLKHFLSTSTARPWMYEGYFSPSHPSSGRPARAEHACHSILASATRGVTAQQVGGTG